MAERVSGIEGLVARIITDDDLIINKGSADGVSVGMIFEILDPRAQNVMDPQTGEDLGSIDRAKARVHITEIGDRLSMARITPPRRGMLSDAASLVAGVSNTSRLTSDTWPEGVKQRDPVKFTGEYVPDI